MSTNKNSKTGTVSRSAALSPETSPMVKRDSEGHYHFFDQVAISCEQGAHGVNPDLAEDEWELYSDARNGVCRESGYFLDSTDPVAYFSDPVCYGDISEQAKEDLIEEFRGRIDGSTFLAVRSVMTGKDGNTLNCDLEGVVVHHGKIHRYAIEDFRKLAPEWHKRLLAEGEELCSGLRFSHDILQDLSAGVVASLTRFWNEVLTLTSAPNPPPKNAFISLHDMCKDVLKTRLLEPAEIEQENLLLAGLEYMAIRRQEKAQLDKLEEFRKEQVAGAGQLVSGLKATDAAAFTALDLAAKAYAIGDPIREAAYRLSAAVLHSVATGVGEWTAGSSGARIFKSLADDLAKKAPGILADLVASLIFRKKGPATPTRWEEICKALIEVVIHVLFEFIIWALFRDQKEASQKRNKNTEKYVIDFLATAIANGLWGAKQRTDSFADKLARQTSQNLVKQIKADYDKCADVATKEKRDLPDVIIAEIPSMLLRLTLSVAKDLASAHLKDGISKDFDARVKKEVLEGETQVGPLTLQWYAKDKRTPALGIQRTEKNAKREARSAFRKNKGIEVKPRKKKSMARRRKEKRKSQRKARRVTRQNR